MQFVIQMASSNGCGSHMLYSLVPNLTSRIVHAFVATGADLERLAYEIEVRCDALNIIVHMMIVFFLHFVHLRIL